MRTVIDVGCARYGGKYDSLERLTEMFEPDRLYGFDPDMEGVRDACFWWPPRLPTEPLGMTYDYRHDSVSISLAAFAAWTYDGQIGFRPGQLGGYTAESLDIKVPCIDLADFILARQGQELILKLDCEGAEYVLVPSLIERGADALLTKILVEWHPTDLGYDSDAMANALRCDYEEWRW